MARPKKYNEPVTNITFYVPQSRKEEIRELVRGVLNGDDGWIEIKSVNDLPNKKLDIWALVKIKNEPISLYFEPMPNDAYSTNFLMEKCSHYKLIDKPQPPKSK